MSVAMDARERLTPAIGNDSGTVDVGTSHRGIGDHERRLRES
jgi:hypothetical protein